MPGHGLSPQYSSQHTFKSMKVNGNGSSSMTLLVGRNIETKTLSSLNGASTLCGGQMVDQFLIQLLH